MSGLDPRLIDAVATAPSRAAGDDDLALLERDVDGALHLAATRDNLLGPLRITAGMRVLELGAGGGGLTRALGERAAATIAYEPDDTLAELARARCHDLPGVRVVGGALEELGQAGPDRPVDEDVDLALIAPIPGLTGLAGPDGPPLGALLEIGVSRLRPGGVLVLAIDNPWGLATLLEAPSSIADRPRTRPGPLQGAPRHAALASLAEVEPTLERLGLGARRRFGVYPDRAVPRVIVAEEMDAWPDAARLVPAFVRDPVGRPAPGTVLLRDPSVALREAWAADIGFALADAHLVVAARAEADVAARCRDGLLFLLPGAEKARPWRRSRILHHAPDAGWWLETVAGGAEARDGPLRARDLRTTIIVGDNGEDLLVPALLDVGPEAPVVRSLLATWWAAASSVATEPDEGGWHFDLAPRNFIVDRGETWHFIDRELTMDDPVPPAVGAWRAIVFTLADRVLPLGMVPGVDPLSTVRDLAAGLLRPLGIATDNDAVEAWIDFESDLQYRVRPAIPDAATEAAALRSILARQVGAWTGAVPLDRLLDAAGRAAGMTALEQRIEALEASVGDAAMALDAQRQRAVAAEAHAVQAEQRASDAEGRHAEAERLAAEAERRAGEAEARSIAADRRAELADAAARDAATRASRSGARNAAEWARDRARLLRPGGSPTNPLFDGPWYLERHPDVRTAAVDPWRHYVQHGAREGRDPNAWFDTDWYLATYPDVEGSGMNPLDHFLRYGLPEGRRPNGRAPSDPAKDQRSGR